MDQTKRCKWCGKTNWPGLTKDGYFYPCAPIARERLMDDEDGDYRHLTEDPEDWWTRNGYDQTTTRPWGPRKPAGY